MTEETTTPLEQDNQGFTAPQQEQPETQAPELKDEASLPLEGTPFTGEKQPFPQGDLPQSPFPMDAGTRELVDHSEERKAAFAQEQQEEEDKKAPEAETKSASDRITPMFEDRSAEQYHQKRASETEEATQRYEDHKQQRADDLEDQAGRV